jgi:hypothetical protein
MALSRHVRSDLRSRPNSSQLGAFWLPEEPQHRVNGVLDVDSGGISLRLHGRFLPGREPTPGDAQGFVYPVIHGDLENPHDSCTLLSGRGWFEFGRYTPLEPRVRIRHGHIDADEMATHVRLEAREFRAPGVETSSDLADLIAAWCRAFDDETVRRACESANRSATSAGRTGLDLFADYYGAVETLAEPLQPDIADHSERVERLMAFIPGDDPDRPWAEQRLASGGQWGRPVPDPGRVRS